MHRLPPSVMALALFAAILNPFSSHAQGTAFTYQGRLNDASGPANGTYDLQFTLYATDTGGSALAGPVTNSLTFVTNGLFVVAVDFGPGAFLGSSNWLDLAVRTNGAAVFTSLAPRQQIRPTPSALYSATAATAASASSVAAGNVAGTLSLSQLPAVLLTNNATGVTLSGNLLGYFGGTFFGNDSGLTGLNPVNLSAGTANININGSAATATTATNLAGSVSDSQLSANVARLNGTNVFSGTNTFAGVTIATNGNSQFAGVFAGNGGGLTNLNLNFSQASGTVPLAQLPPAVVTNNETGVTLSGTFNGNGAGLTNLNPASLAAGTANINISGNAATATLAASVANGAIGSAQLASGAAAANLAASGQSGVPSGGLVLSPVDNTALLNAGYVKIGATTLNDSWQQKSGGAYLSARYQAAAVWDGTEMIVWGGLNNNGVAVNDGARYNPAANVWTLIPTNGAPAARFQHSAVWDGTELIVWGGEKAASSYLNDGGRYNPVANAWTAVPTNGAPTARFLHTAVWDGTEMIVWGGLNSSILGDGASYNPALNAWTTLSSAGAPTGRIYHTAVWDGTEMIVWGGQTAAGFVNTGARYNPFSNTWTAATATAGAPAGREVHSAIWDGKGMIVWGGYTGILTNDGGRYDPAADAWTALPLLGAPAGRYAHSAVWDGSGMIIWGGTTNIASAITSSVSDGARYLPATGTWSPLAMNNVPGPRLYHATVWDGSEMIVWGGLGGSANALSDGGRYSPATGGWAPISTNASLAVRGYHTAVWDGTEMIVWGGFNATGTAFNDGQRYLPAANMWKSMSGVGAPAGRYYHTAIWNGTEMIVWGGVTNSSASLINTGGRYNPVSDTWLPVTTTAAPMARRYHTAVWDGTGMIIWGGSTNSGLSFVNDGARYVPSQDAWYALTSVGAPLPRGYHTAVWDGSGMMVWGGASNNGTSYFNDGARYSPASGNWTTLPASPLSVRGLHSAIWNGSEMIVWGGSTNFSNGFSDGARYNPTAGTWTVLPTNNAPFPRLQHTAIWDGSGMIIWGGAYSGLANVTGSEGGRYTPANNAWTPTSTLAPPAPRSGHSAVWDGNEMLIFGGFSGFSYTNDLWSYTPPKTMILYQKP